MKNVFFALSLLFTTSCDQVFTQNRFKEVEPAITEFLQKNLKNPDSFEYIDSYKLEITGSDLRNWFSILDSGLENKARSKPYLKIEIDSIFSNNKIYGYEYYLQYRAKNSFNTLDNSTEIFGLTSKGELVKTPDDESSLKEKVYLAEISPILNSL